MQHRRRGRRNPRARGEYMQCQNDGAYRGVYFVEIESNHGKQKKTLNKNCEKDTNHIEEKKIETSSFCPYTII